MVLLNFSDTKHNKNKTQKNQKMHNHQQHPTSSQTPQAYTKTTGTLIRKNTTIQQTTPTKNRTAARWCSGQA